MFCEVARGDLYDDIQEKVGIVLVEAGQFLFSHSIKFLPVLRRYGIPDLGASAVHVIDGVEHDILVMPAERGVHHPKIHPRQCYAAYPFVFSKEL